MISTGAIFKGCCISVAFSMAIFWLNKYYLDENLVEIDYRMYKDSKDVTLTMLSLCFWHPVSEEKLKSYNNTFTVSDYNRFLSGRKYIEGMEKADFHNVSINLNNFFFGH